VGSLGVALRLNRFFLTFVATLGTNASKGVECCDLQALGSEANHLSVSNRGKLNKLRGI
jgi:hypothetical protein